MRRSGNRVRRAIGHLGAGIPRAAAGLGLAAAALLLARRTRGRRAASRHLRGGGDGSLPLPGAYARLLRSLSAAGRRRPAGAPFEDLLRDAVDRSPVLLPPAERFLALYHRERFGPHPLSAGESAEAGRLADLLRRRLPRPVDR